jgi:hypothetical protein
MPALTFGPNGGNYHGTDEYVELDFLMKSTRVLALCIMAWCGIDLFLETLSGVFHMAQGRESVFRVSIKLRVLHCPMHP